ncbi:MAG: leucine--tRNA ligase [Saprospiraceae bacterium]|nr:leucine--tRNA ligase [Saprospiraceae bacterium]
MEYRPSEVEHKWKEIWKANGLYQINIYQQKPKYYVLDMFPYPSGAGLHVGHPLGYIASDIFARKKRMDGYQVLHPMGFDAFGLPAEQYAIQTGVHPAVSTYQNIERYRQQLFNIGLSFDWSREVITCDPKYYKWTQWIFLQLFNHYYDNRLQKAKPISDLMARFESEGSTTIQAACSENPDFSAEEWKKMSAARKDAILMNYRLAYRKIAYVNWCEALGTVLANDEIKDGVSERGGHPVEKKPMMQWALRISAYAERLLQDLDTLEWSDALKTMQKNWIGKSKGCSIFFQLENNHARIEVFSTRPDTIFGASFIALAPEHPMAQALSSPEKQQEVLSYIKASAAKSDRERSSETKTVSGVFTGSFAIHPFNQKPLPVYITDYVLVDYGTGAIMGVPAHDKRDQLFAQKFELPIVQVVDFGDRADADIEDKSGTLVNSDFLNGLDVPQAIESAISKLESLHAGSGKVLYKMRDANFSRQRYWGEPIPVSYDQDGCSFAAKSEDLPLMLPSMESIEPGIGGKSPLSRAHDWIKNGEFERETDTMPGYAGSSWYFLRYMDPNNDSAFASKEALDYWKDVDLYIGGTEHAVGHLMYSRFWHKFLYDLNYVPTTEPFKKLVNQGMIQGVIESVYLLKSKNQDQPAKFISANLADGFPIEELAKIPVHIDFISQYNTANSHLDKNGILQFVKWRPEFQSAVFKNETESGTAQSLSENFKLKTVSETGKMSKRYHNVVNPDDVIREYGADCFRMYEMFLGPIEQSKPWDTKGIDGVSKFLRKYHSMFYNPEGAVVLDAAPPSKEALSILHSCIKKVNTDIEQLSLNTCISAFMICVNELRRINCTNKDLLLQLTQLMAPFAPFITEEIWSQFNGSGSIHESPYPKHNEDYLQKDTVNYPVSINGKKRMEWEISKTHTVDEIKAMVVELPEIKKWIESGPIKNIIVVPGRMVNIVM